MDVRFIADSSIHHHEASDLPDLIDRDDGLLWVDIPEPDAEALHALSEVFGFHPRAVRDCAERNRVPKVHAYPGHVFVVLHEPELGRAGHVHNIELDQFIGPNYLVTVHGPVNPAVSRDVTSRHTRAVVQRIESGRLYPTTSFELSYAIVSQVTRHMEAFIEEMTEQTWRLEQTVMGGDIADPEEFLEELFRTRHGLLAVRTMAALGHEIYGRMTALARFLPPDALPLVEDVVDQFSRLRGLAENEKDYLHGVIEFYRTRTETKMTIAAERLAVIAVVTLPITALASIYGMNVIVNASTDFVHLVVVLVLMALVSGWLLRWAKKQGWW